MTSERFNKLVTLLKELFQLDKPELDFGFYRIMHARSAEVTGFLENELLPQVRAALEEYVSVDRAQIERELQEATDQARSLGVDPDATDKVKELKAKRAQAGDLDAVEADVYDHLYRFFRRYYKDGDFISQRVYKDGVYAIPYQGEEVKLHWANADQYYIKTDEYLRNYSFRLRPDGETDPMRVHFRLADAAEGEHGNVKAADDRKRVFVLANGDFAVDEPGERGTSELVLRFEYRPATMNDWPESEQPGKSKAPNQKSLLDIAEARIFKSGVTEPHLRRWTAALERKHVKRNGERSETSRLRTHLDRYTARNTFDYFIHKDLGGFLRRELDFYIKNEVMRLDDIENDTAPRAEQYLSKIRAIRRIAGTIIDFLASLEDFQKRLWLKKKFVVETSYCIRVGCIPDEFLPEIAANDTQRREWVDLCGIDEIESELTTPGYSEPLSVEFLRSQPTLMVDTRHFTRDFRDSLLKLGEHAVLDEATSGSLIHGENLQALRLLQHRYSSQVECVYIDPPYNSAASSILYKNDYQHSSWLALMADRLRLSGTYLTKQGVLGCAIDENELAHLLAALKHSLPAHDPQVVMVHHYPGSGSGRGNVSYTHEYYVAAVPSGESVLVGSRRPGGTRKRNFRRSGQGENNFRSGRHRSFFAILVDPATLEIVGMEKPPPRDSTYPEEPTEQGWLRIYPIGSDGSERVWSRNYTSSKRLWLDGRLECSDQYAINHSIDDEGRKVLVSAWLDSKFNSVVHGTNLVADIMGEKAAFPYPKSVHTVRTAIDSVMGDHAGASVLDYFAGSGTTGHAVINLNREDGGDRRFILVEMGEHFDTVLLPRLKKVTYSPEWKDGKPVRQATAEEAERSPSVMKVIRLESYEDTLNNLRHLNAETGDLERTASGDSPSNPQQAGSPTPPPPDNFVARFTGHPIGWQVGQPSPPLPSRRRYPARWVAPRRRAVRRPDGVHAQNQTARCGREPGNPGRPPRDVQLAARPPGLSALGAPGGRGGVRERL